MSDVLKLDATLHDLYEQVVVSDSLGKNRAKAWERYRALGLPNQKSHGYRHIKLRALIEGSYQLSTSLAVDPQRLASHTLEECCGTLVLINGQFSQEHSTLPEGISVMPLQKAWRTYGTFLTGRWSKGLKDENDPFAALNGAIHQGGLFIYVPPKLQVEKPLHILHLIDKEEDTVAVTPRVHAFFGSQSQIDLISTCDIAPDTSFWMNQVTDLAVEDGAKVTFTALNDYVDGGWVFDSLRATLKRDSSLQVYNLGCGGKTVRHDYVATLLGENGEVALHGAAMLRDRAEGHAKVRVEHVAPHCRSRQLFKHVLSDTARTSFEGMIDIDHEAQKSDAFQLNNNLILSDRAIAHSKPELKVRADDVKASHGCTVGQLDKELLFYLQARGIGQKEAERLLVTGFLREVADMVPVTAVRQRAIKMVEAYLS